MVNESGNHDERLTGNNEGNHVLDKLAGGLTGGKKEIEFSYREVEGIIKNYYEKSGKENVNVRITNKENEADGVHSGGIFTKIFVSMDVMVMGIKKTEKIEISMDLVKKIIASLLEKEGKKLTKIENNVHYGTHDVGWGPGERKERFLTGKNFRIVFSDK